MALPHRSSMEVADYLELDRTSLDTRYEYIDGSVTMLAGGTANHATIAVNVTSLLHQLLRGTSCRVYNSDLRVQLSASRYVYPDASVSCDERDRGQNETIRSPHLIVEVFSPGTEAYDRGRKFAYYRACPTIQEYVLIDSQHLAVDIFRRQKNSFWTFHAFSSGDEIELASLQLHFPIAALYENVTLPPEHTDQSGS